MDFDAMLEQVLELLQRQGRVSYRAIKRRFDIDDSYVEDLKEEILFTHPHVVDEEGRGLVWSDPASSTAMTPPPDTPEDQVSSVVEPPAAPPTSEAERRQLTVMFCDLDVHFTSPVPV